MSRLCNELPQQQFKAYFGGLAIWFALPDVPSQAYFVFEIWEVKYYD